MNDLDVKIRGCAKRAAQVLRDRGHCKGRYQAYKGEVCLFGALATASGLQPGFVDGLHAHVADRIVKLLQLPQLTPTWMSTWQLLTAWNDAVIRKPDEVIGILERVAAFPT